MNSFLAIVEFGDKVRARAVTAGGESGDLREVYFYREQLKGHTEREYHPGN